MQLFLVRHTYTQQADAQSVTRVGLYASRTGLLDYSGRAVTQLK